MTDKCNRCPGCITISIYDHVYNVLARNKGHSAGKIRGGGGELPQDSKKVIKYIFTLGDSQPTLFSFPRGVHPRRKLRSCVALLILCMASRVRGSSTEELNETN